MLKHGYYETSDLDSGHGSLLFLRPIGYNSKKTFFKRKINKYIQNLDIIEEFNSAVSFTDEKQNVNKNILF